MCRGKIFFKMFRYMYSVQNSERNKYETRIKIAATLTDIFFNRTNECNRNDIRFSFVPNLFKKIICECIFTYYTFETEGKNDTICFYTNEYAVLTKRAHYT